MTWGVWIHRVCIQTSSGISQHATREFTRKLAGPQGICAQVLREEGLEGGWPSRGAQGCQGCQGCLSTGHPCPDLDMDVLVLAGSFPACQPASVQEPQVGCKDYHHSTSYCYVNVAGQGPGSQVRSRLYLPTLISRNNENARSNLESLVLSRLVSLVHFTLVRPRLEPFPFHLLGRLPSFKHRFPTSSRFAPLLASSRAGIDVEGHPVLRRGRYDTVRNAWIQRRQQY